MSGLASTRVCSYCHGPTLVLQVLNLTPEQEREIMVQKNREMEISSKTTGVIVEKKKKTGKREDLQMCALLMRVAR